MACEDCIKIGIPIYLCEDGQSHPIAFLLEELLFRRHTLKGDRDAICNLPEPIIGDKLFRLRDDSYNRSLFSKPLDVLFKDDSLDGSDHYLNQGVISLPVETLSSVEFKYQSNGVNKTCTFELVHTSRHCNYSHCEILFYIDGVKFTGNKPNKSAVSFFRRRLLNMLTVIKEAS